MATRIKQSAKLRPRAKVNISSDYDDKKIIIRVPRGKRIRIKRV